MSDSPDNAAPSDPRPPVGPRTPGEAAQVALQLGELAQAALPLVGGLRAAAAEMPRRRVARALSALADDLEAGVPLERAVESSSARLPAAFRGVLAIGVRTGRLGEVLAEYLRHERLADELRRKLWSALAYPTLLLVLLVGWVAFMAWEFEDFVRDGWFQSPEVIWTVRKKVPAPSETDNILHWLEVDRGAVYAAAGLGGIGTLIALLTVFGAGRQLSAIARPLPLIGPLLHYRAMSELCDMLRMLVERETRLPDALRLAGASCPDAALSRRCQLAAAAVETGQDLAHAADAVTLFPPSMTPLLAWGEQSGTPAGAFRTLADLARQRVSLLATLMASALPFSILLIVAAVVLSVASALFGDFYVVVSTLSFRAAVIVREIGTLLGIFGVLTVGATLLVTERITSARALRRQDEAAEIVRFMGRVLVATGMLGLGWLVGQSYGVAVWLAAIATWAMAASQLRASAQTALLELLVAAIEQNQPLPLLVERFATEHTGPHGRRLAMFAKWLASGTSLAEAIRQSPGVLPPHASAALACAEPIGDVGAALREAAQVNTAAESPMRRDLGRLLYLLWYGCGPLAGLLTFLAVSIIPQFKSIVADFGLDAPNTTRQMFNVTEWLLATAALPAVLCVFAVLTIYATLYYMGWIRFRLPGMTWLLKKLDAAAVLRTLALAAEREAPFEPVLAALAKSYPRWSIRRRLQRVALDVHRGGDWIDSLRRAGLLGRAEQRVLEAARPAGNLPWALREMADCSERRLAHRMNAVSQVLFPLGILAIGGLTFLVAVGYFMPLVALISELSMR